MELEKKQIHKNREKGRAFSQITLDDDYNLPDYKPDLMKVIKEKGIIHFEEINVSSGHVWIKGMLVFQILYRTDLDGRKVNRLKGEIPFQENLSMDGIEDLDPVKVNGRIEDISVSVINSRKLSIRSLVEFRASADDMEEEGLVTGINEADQCEIDKRNLEVLEMLISKKDTFRMKQEISLPSNKPNIEEVLWNSVELRGMECRLKSGEILVTGEALVYALYSGEEEEERLQWFETTVPIHGSVDCGVCQESNIFKITVEPAQADMEPKPDEDGEERQLLLDMVMNLDIRIWQEEQVELIEDIYALDKQIIPECKPIVFEKLLMKNDSKCRISEKVEIGEGQENVFQICSSEEKVTIEQMTPSEEGLMVEGIMSIELLYLTTDEAMPLGAKKAYVPFQQLIEMPTTGENARMEVDGGIDQVTTVLLDGKTIEVKAVINLNLIAFEKQEIKVITDLREEEADYEALQKRPGIVGYIVKEGDRLFHIAKENHTTVANLMAANRLQSEQIKPGEKLLIVKTVG